jgi:apolipoprotein N-acyltransferase
MSVWRGFAKPVRYAALASGALPVLAFPAPNIEVLAWVGLVPGLLILRASATAREAAVRGCWFGTGFMLAAHYWLVPNIGPALLLVAVLLGALWLGVGVSAWALLRDPLTARRALAALVVVPSYWLIIEWIRSWQALGGPWALLGASQWQHPAVLALAAVGGVWLVSFALVAANTGLAILLIARRPAIRVLGGAAACAVVAAGPAAFALSPPLHPQSHITLALIQPGIVHDPRLRLDASERMSAGLGPRHPGLIVWGESSVGYDLWRDPALLGRIERLSAALGAQILVNQDTITPRGKSKVAMLVGRSGIAASYAKTRLVPFGEYVPFREQLGWLTKISRAAAVNIVPGDGAHVLTVTVPAGHALLSTSQPAQSLQPSQSVQPPRPGYSLRIGVLICFEAAFPDMSRADVRHGARLLVFQTSDSTFQGSWAPAQHASLAALRAAETGRPAVQAALTGVTAAFDARGRLLRWLPTSQRGVAVVRLDLPSGSDRTLFDRFGDLVPWAAIGISVLTAGLALNHPGGPQRLIGIMVEGNRQPAPSVSVSEAVSRNVRIPKPTEPGGGAASSPQAGD